MVRLRLIFFSIVNCVSWVIRLFEGPVQSKDQAVAEVKFVLLCCLMGGFVFLAGLSISFLMGV